MYESGELAETLGIEAAEPSRARGRPQRLGAADDREPPVDQTVAGGPGVSPSRARGRAPLVALRFDAGALWALDQTRLPWDESGWSCADADEVAAAIRRLSIRGAPLIGVAAGLRGGARRRSDPAT